MNILFVAHECELNGASRSLLGLIDQLEDNHNIYVLTNYKKGDFIDELKKRKVEIIHGYYRKWLIFKPRSNIRWFFKRLICIMALQINNITVFTLKRKIQSYNIDIIHTNTSVINIGAVLAKQCNIPHIWHIREFGKEDFNLFFILGEKYSNNFISKNSDFVITISHALYRKYQKYISEKNLVMIYNGIDNSTIGVKKIVDSKDIYNILITGAITKNKGQQEAINAFKELKNRGYENIKLLIAGDGEIESIKKMIHQLNIEDDVKLLGRVKDMSTVRENADIELVCSKSEAFGRVTIEAMMSKIPIVGANTAGTKELIEDGHNGLLYEQGNSIDLANKIEILLNNTSYRKELSDNAFEFSKGFTSSANAHKIYNLYTNLIKK